MVGSGRPPATLMNSANRQIDCQGYTLIPGFNDAHCHILATISKFVSVDCSPETVSSIHEIAIRLQNHANQFPVDTWIRGIGFNEFYLKEHRTPTKWDLDHALPNHPVKLLHQSGHAVVLNSRALDIIQLSKESVDPPYGVIDRDQNTGEPTGVLFDMDNHLNQVIPTLSSNELELGASIFNQECIRMGITSLQDATPTNFSDRWSLFKDFKVRSILNPSIVLMSDAEHFELAQEERFKFNDTDSTLRLGPVKIIAGMTTGTLYPSYNELKCKVAEIHKQGLQVAIHAIEPETIEAASHAISQAIFPNNATEFRHRIEHCSECSSGLIDDLAQIGVTVVTQPGFLYFNGHRYLEEIPSQRQLSLYRFNSMEVSNIQIGFGSDSPVIPINPLIGIYAAVTRRTSSGKFIGLPESLSAESALKAYTLGSARAVFDEGIRGSIAIGKIADMALLDADPTNCEPEKIKSISNLMTICGGKVVWEQ
ncbi:amidohydrolase [SAR202 cluster bacterium AD-802-E10_MRT_200m]|nr:amidohydrolase [SAR202 cluster bacterium AD-802-E10_MRT_200m]MQF82779.1 amidohydrolase [SAR202 cluster bacterium AD-802-E10_MRT_200m]